jgi:hypothetical protein
MNLNKLRLGEFLMTSEETQIQAYKRWQWLRPFFGVWITAALAGIVIILLGLFYDSSMFYVLIFLAILVAITILLARFASSDKISLDDRVRYYARKEGLKGPDIVEKLLPQQDGSWGMNSLVTCLRKEGFGASIAYDDQTVVLEVSEDRIPDADAQKKFNQVLYRDPSIAYRSVPNTIYK